MFTESRCTVQAQILLSTADTFINAIVLHPSRHVLIMDGAVWSALRTAFAEMQCQRALSAFCQFLTPAPAGGTRSWCSGGAWREPHPPDREPPAEDAVRRTPATHFILAPLILSGLTRSFCCSACVAVLLGLTRSCRRPFVGCSPLSACVESSSRLRTMRP